MEPCSTVRKRRRSSTHCRDVRGDAGADIRRARRVAGLVGRTRAADRHGIAALIRHLRREAEGHRRTRVAVHGGDIATRASVVHQGQRLTGAKSGDGAADRVGVGRAGQCHRVDVRIDTRTRPGRAGDAAGLVRRTRATDRHGVAAQIRHWCGEGERHW